MIYNDEEGGDTSGSDGEVDGVNNGEDMEIMIEEENLRLVLGSVVCGHGRIDCGKLLAMLDLPDLSYRQWSKGLHILSNCVGKLSGSSMDRALQEEVEHAKRANKPTATVQG